MAECKARTSITIPPKTLEKVRSVKDGLTWEELLEEMAEQYDSSGGSGEPPKAENAPEIH